MNPTPANPQQPEVGEGAQALVVTLRLGFNLLRLLLLIMLLVYAFSGIFILDQNEEALVYRFGRQVGEVRTSGRWHFAWPKPIDQVVRLPVGKSHTLSSNHFWFKEQDRNILSNPNEGPPPEGPEQGLVTGTDGYLLTADTNIIHTKWEVTYRIADPQAYHTRYANPDTVLRSLLDNAVLRQVAVLPIKAVFYQGTELKQALGGSDLQLVIRDELQRAAGVHQLGVTIDQVNYVDKTPPRSTLASFSLVLEAALGSSKSVNDADAYRMSRLQEARGESSRIANEAQADYDRLTASVEGDAAYLKRILEEYQSKGEAIIIGLYTDVLRDVVTGADAKYIVHPGQEVRIQLGPEKQNPNTPQRQPGP